MSLIYDALRRAESERPGQADTTSADAAELLKRAERQARAQRNAEVTTNNSDLPYLFGNRERNSSQELETNNDPSHGAVLALDTPEQLALSSFPSLNMPLPFDERLVVLADNENPVAEAFRLLGVRLRHMRRERAIKTLLICSTATQEGKSMISANLACTIAAASRQNVLLIEGDIRRPSLSQIFGLAPQPGLCEYLHAKRPLEDSIYRLDEASLWFMPAGISPDSHVELTQASMLPPMIRQLEESFSWIIIDSAPVLPLADTSVWERLADSILLIARNSTTEKRKLDRGLEAIDTDKLIGAVINSATSSTEEDYYYYHDRSASSTTVGDV